MRRSPRRGRARRSAVKQGHLDARHEAFRCVGLHALKDVTGVFPDSVRTVGRHGFIVTDLGVVRLDEPVVTIHEEPQVVRPDNRRKEPGSEKADHSRAPETVGAVTLVRRLRHPPLQTGLSERAKAFVR